MFLGDIIDRYRKKLGEIKTLYAKPADSAGFSNASSTSMLPQNGSPVNSPSLQKDSMAFPTDPKNPVLQKPVTQPTQNLGQKLMTLPESKAQSMAEQAAMVGQGMRQGMSDTPQRGYQGVFHPEASKVAQEEMNNMVMGSTGEMKSIAGEAAPLVRSIAEEAASKVASKVKGKIPKIDVPTQKEMIEIIDYARLKPGFNQKLEENAGLLAEKFGVKGKSIADIANKFDDLIQKIKGKKGYPSALKEAGNVAEDQHLIEAAKKFKTPEEFIDSQFNAKPSYAMGHRPARTGATAADITSSPDGMGFPSDFYQHPEYYENMKDESVKESFDVLKKIKDNPDAEITIYRAGPKDEFNPGDWISLSKKYAHGESLQEGTKVYKRKVKAKDVQFAGDSINEFGYFPESRLRDIWTAAKKSPLN